MSDRKEKSDSPVKFVCEESAKESDAESDGPGRRYNLRSRIPVMAELGAKSERAKKGAFYSSDTGEPEKEGSGLIKQTAHDTMYEKKQYEYRVSQSSLLKEHCAELDDEISLLTERKEKLEEERVELQVDVERRRGILQQVIDMVHELRIAADNIEKERVQTLSIIEQQKTELVELASMRQVKAEQKSEAVACVQKLQRELAEAVNEQTRAEDALKECHRKSVEARAMREAYEKEEEKASAEWELRVQEKARDRYRKFQTVMSSSEQGDSDLCEKEGNEHNPGYVHGVSRPKRASRIPKLKKSVRRQKVQPSSSSESETDAGRSSGKAKMKPQRFNGKGVFADFLSQFEACKAYNHWSTREAAFQLFNLCDDVALSSLTGEGIDPKVSSYEDMVDVLEREYGPRECKSSYMLELNQVRQNQGESARELGNRIKKLTALAFRGKDAGTKATRDEMALNCFVMALRRKDVRDVVFGAEFKTLKHAVDKAEYLESYHKKDDEVHERKRERHVSFNRRVGEEKLVTHKSDSESEIEERVYERLVQTFGLTPEVTSPEPPQSTERDLEVSVRTLVDTTRDLRDTLAHMQPRTSNSGTPPPRRKRENPVCYFCGEVGHMRRECPHQPQLPPPPQRQSTPGRGYCLNCKELGHEWRECRWPSLCFVCGQDDHWSRNCPMNMQGNGRRPSQGPQGRPQQLMRGQNVLRQSNQNQ